MTSSFLEAVKRDYNSMRLTESGKNSFEAKMAKAIIKIDKALQEFYENNNFPVGHVLLKIQRILDQKQ